jgi:adenosylcobinamide hydrolase
MKEAAMKLYTISTGDQAYRYDKSIVVFFKGPRKVSLHLRL